MRFNQWLLSGLILTLVGCNANEGSVPTAYVCDGEEQLATGEARSGNTKARETVTNLQAVLERSFKDKPKFFSIETKLAGPLRGKYCGDSPKGDFIFRPGDCTNYQDLIAFHAEDKELIIHFPVQKDRPDEYEASFTCRLKDAPKPTK